MKITCDKCKKRVFPHANDGSICITDNRYLCRECFYLWDMYHASISTFEEYDKIYNDWLNKPKGFVFR